VRERFTEADVDKRIKGERTYLARFTESGRVTMDLGEGGNVNVEDRAQEDRRDARQLLQAQEGRASRS
jgi:hypothetical protein